MSNITFLFGSSIEERIIRIIFILILCCVAMMINNIYKKRYKFKISDFTELSISCVTLGLAMGTCYVLIYFAIYNKLLTESTSSLAVRLFSMLGGFYLCIKSISIFIEKINEIFK